MDVGKIDQKCFKNQQKLDWFKALNSTSFPVPAIAPSPDSLEMQINLLLPQWHVQDSI